MSDQRRPHVLLLPNDEVAEHLRLHPGEWFLVGTGTDDRQKHILRQTGHRIRRGALADFASCSDGNFEATSDANQAHADRIAYAELYARWVPAGLSDGTSPNGLSALPLQRQT